MSIIDDKEFYQARKCLEPRSKLFFTKKARQTKSNADEALTDDDVNIPLEKYFTLATF